MRYVTDEQITERLTRLLSHTAPGFNLLHYTVSPMHDHMRLVVCAANGIHRLSFSVKMWTRYSTQEGFLGIFPDAPNDAHCQFNYQFGIDRRVQMLMRVHPNAHIQLIDNEEDGDDALFGYVAYDDNYRPLAWAPVPIEDGDEDETMPDETAHITHTLPDLDADMEHIKGVEGDDPDNIV